ncbi:MAG: MATE family efflux transporter [Bacteroidota bacterium]
MKVGINYKNIWEISYPIILGGLANTLLNLTDTAFVSRLGETELASMALTTIYYFVIVMIAISIGVGIQILMSRRAGEGDRDEIGKIFDHGFLILSISGFVFTMVMHFTTSTLFKNILSSQDVLDASMQYISTRSFGLFFAFTTIAFRSFFISIGNTKIITFSAVLMLCMNFVLDYMLIFGNWGAPEMGIKGAALASVISEATALLFLVGYSLKKHEFKEFRLFRFDTISLSRFRAIMNLSSPIVLQNLISMGAWFLFFVVIEHMGERELAISNIIRATYMIMMTPVWGYAAATNSMVSNLIGQGRQNEVGMLVKRIIKLALATSSVIFLLMVISPSTILGISTSDDSIISQSMGCYYIISGAMFLFSISVILLSTVSGTGSTKAAMVIEVTNILIYLAYVYICAIVLKSSIEWVWFSEGFYWTLMGLFSYLYLKTGKWKVVKI